MNKWESLCWKSIECKRRKMEEKSDRKFSEWGASRLKHETRLSQIDFRIRSVVVLLRDFPELAFLSFPTQRQALPHAYCRRFRTERSMKCGRWNFTILVRWSLFRFVFFSTHTRRRRQPPLFTIIIFIKVYKTTKIKMLFLFLFSAFLLSRSTRNDHAMREKNTWTQQEMKTSNNRRNFFIFGKQVAGISQFHPKMQRCKSPRRPVERFSDAL